MPENYALYSQIEDRLPPTQMKVLADDVAPQVSKTEQGTTYTYRWPDLTIIVSEMPASQIEDHLRGFAGYIRQVVFGGEVPARGKKIIRRIRATRLVVGVEFQAGRDEQGRAEELLGRMCGGLRPVIFHEDAIYDWMFRSVLAPDGTFDPTAELE